MSTSIEAIHVEDWVILSDSEGNKLAKIKPEDAIRLANNLLDEAERALRNSVEE